MKGNAGRSCFAKGGLQIPSIEVELLAVKRDGLLQLVIIEEKLDFVIKNLAALERAAHHAADLCKTVPIATVELGSRCRRRSQAFVRRLHSGAKSAHRPRKRPTEIGEANTSSP